MCGWVLRRRPGHTWARRDGDAPVVAATPARLPWLQRHGVLGRADSFTELSACSEWSAASSCAPPSPMSSPAAAAAAASADTTRPRGKWTLCILLELCGCTPLSRWLREHPPTVERAEQIFVQVRRPSFRLSRRFGCRIARGVETPTHGGTLGRRCRCCEG